MTTYYVDFVNGLDANNGLGPDASDGTNKPWKTIAKLLGASGMASGDTAYLSPAGPFREVVTVAMTSAVAETKVLGDPGNAQGFKTSGGVRVAPGPVIWTAYTTNDKTAPSASSLLTLAGRDFLTFQDITLVPGSAASCVLATTTTSINCTFRRVTVLPGANISPVAFNMTAASGVAFNWTFDSCIMISGNPSGIIALSAPAGPTVDYDINVQIFNCVFHMFSAGQIVRLTGAASNKPGGIDIYNCTFVGGTAFQVATGGSTSIPCTFYNNVVMGTNGLVATATGEITEDFNILLSGTARTNTSTGANSISNGSYANLLELGQAQLNGATVRPFLTPMASSPVLGFGAQAGGPAVDILGRPRPAGGASTNYALGAYERHDTGALTTSVTQAGSNAMQIAGPGDQDFELPVNAVSTTISVYGQYDTNHGTGNKPQMTVTNGGECGVNDATATMTVGTDTWEQISLTFTPARVGIVTVRLISRAAAGNGNAYFDTFAVA